MINKQFIYELYDKTGTVFKKRLDNDIVDNYIPSFSSQINIGLSELSVGVKQRYDDYDPNLVNGNVLKIYKQGVSNSLYEGFINNVKPTRDGKKETVGIDITPYNALLSEVAYRQGSSYIFTKTDRIDNIFRDIIDQFQINTGLSYIYYGESSIVDLGATIPLEIDKEYTIDSLERTFSMIGSTGYYMRFDPDGKFNVLQKPTTADHVFTVGANTEKIMGNIDARNVVSRGFIEYGPSLLDTLIYEGNSAYFVREIMISDKNITGITEASLRLATEVENQMDERIGAELIINSGYFYDNKRIEDAIEGTTCKLKEVNAGFLGNNMMITQRRYNGVNVNLVLESDIFSVQKQIKKYFDKRDKK